MLIIGLIFSLTSFANAQQGTNPLRLQLLENYIRVLSSPADSRIQIFSQSSPKDKSDLIRLHLAFQFVKHPKLNQEQKDLILDSIGFATPESYLEANRMAAQQQSVLIQQRAMKLFSRELGNQIFADFSESPETTDALKKYKSVIAISTLATRKSAVDKVSPEQISFFYKMQMAFSLAINSNLSREQQNLILEVMSQVSPELYKNKNSAELKAKQNFFKPLEDKIIKAFPTEIGGTTFAMIGDVEIDIEESGARCHCLLDSWFSGCSVSSTCKGGTCDDNPNNGTRCGFLGLWACNGRCS